MINSNDNDLEEEIRNKIDKACLIKDDMKVNFLKDADNIQYNNSQEFLQIDNYGFLKTKNDEINNKNQKNLLQENARIEKWLLMFKDFETYKMQNPSKVKKRIRNGIPDSLRGIAWMKLMKIKEIKEQFKENYYKELVEKQAEKSEEDVILKDLNRTFPYHYLFKDQYGLGQRKLYNILKAFSIHSKLTGYVQGMGFICAVFLTYVEEENAFWMLVSLMVNYNMENYYTPCFPELNKSFYILFSLLKLQIKDIFFLFKKYEIIPSMFASNWFITLFTNYLPFNIVIRFFDCFFYEGEKIIYRFALGLFKMKKDEILRSKNIESLLKTLKNMNKSIEEDDYVQDSFKINISRKDIKKLKDEYENITNTNKISNDVMDMIKI